MRSRSGSIPSARNSSSEREVRGAWPAAPEGAQHPDRAGQSGSQVGALDTRQLIAPAIFDAARLISVHSPLRITSNPIAGKPQVKILSQPGSAMHPVDAGFAGS